jgi:hypothetical protein
MLVPIFNVKVQQVAEGARGFFPRRMIGDDTNMLIPAHEWDRSGWFSLGTTWFSLGTTWFRLGTQHAHPANEWDCSGIKFSMKFSIVTQFLSAVKFSKVVLFCETTQQESTDV